MAGASRDLSGPEVQSSPGPRTTSCRCRLQMGGLVVGTCQVRNKPQLKGAKFRIIAPIGIQEAANSIGFRYKRRIAVFFLRSSFKYWAGGDGVRFIFHWVHVRDRVSSLETRVLLHDHFSSPISESALSSTKQKQINLAKACLQKLVYFTSKYKMPQLEIS